MTVRARYPAGTASTTARTCSVASGTTGVASSTGRRMPRQGLRKMIPSVTPALNTAPIHRYATLRLEGASASLRLFTHAWISEGRTAASGREPNVGRMWRRRVRSTIAAVASSWTCAARHAAA